MYFFSQKFSKICKTYIYLWGWKAFFLYFFSIIFYTKKSKNTFKIDKKVVKFFHFFKKIFKNLKNTKYGVQSQLNLKATYKAKNTNFLVFFWFLHKNLKFRFKIDKNSSYFSFLSNNKTIIKAQNVNFVVFFVILQKNKGILLRKNVKKTKILLFF